MASRRILPFIDDMQRPYDMRGVTLVEIIVVVAITTIIARIALAISFDTYRSSSFGNSRALLVATLEHARAEAINNICKGDDCTQGASHGVFIEENNYVLFQGESFASRDASYDVDVDTNATGTYTGLTEIVFSALSGDVAHTGTITLADGAGHVSTTTIGSYGQISWTH